MSYLSAADIELFYTIGCITTGATFSYQLNPDRVDEALIKNQDPETMKQLVAIQRVHKQFTKQWTADMLKYRNEKYLGRDMNKLLAQIEELQSAAKITMPRETYDLHVRMAAALSALDIMETH
jgi:hypothetical protein